MVGKGFSLKSMFLRGFRSAFLSGISCAILSLFCTVQSPAAPVESASGTIYIILGTHGGGGASANSSINNSITALKNYVQNNIVNGDTSLVYVSSYGLAQGTPADFAREYLSHSSGTSILDAALATWYSDGFSSELQNLKSTYTTLDQLRAARPDVVPSRYVVIADGAAGLAVRE